MATRDLNTPEQPRRSPRDERTFTKKRLFFLLIAALVIMVFQVVAYRHDILNNLGTYLVFRQAPQQADVIVVLSSWNDTAVRARGAADLYHRKLAPRILIPRMEPMEGVTELVDRGIAMPEHAELVTTVLQGLGVPADAVRTTEQTVTSTLEEAEAIRAFLTEEGYRSLLLVTSRYHSRRAYLIFSDILGDAAAVTSVPSPYDSFDPVEWWTRQRDWKRVLSEYEKLMLYWWRKTF
jgi:uncharacterized SAM-binding protein YcdF (DUF218 family)